MDSTAFYAQLTTSVTSIINLLQEGCENSLYWKNRKTQLKQENTIKTVEAGERDGGPLGSRKNGAAGCCLYSL